MTEALMQPESHDAAPAALQELYRDPTLEVGRLLPDASVEVGFPEQPIVHNQPAPYERGEMLHNVVHANGENYAICSMPVSGRQVLYVTRAGKPGEQAAFVGLVGDKPLRIRDENAAGRHTALFSVSAGNGKNWEAPAVHNFSEEPLTIARAVQPEHVAPEQPKSMMRRLVTGALKRVSRQRRHGSPNQEPTFAESQEWQVPEQEVHMAVWTENQKQQRAQAVVLGRPSRGSRSQIAEPAPKAQAVEQPAPIEEIQQEQVEPLRTFAPAPSFAEQIASAEAGERANPLRYEPVSIDKDGGWLLSDEREVTTEGEALLNLRNFMERAVAVAQQTGDAEMLERAESSLKKTMFMGERETQTAIEGMAKYWSDYLNEDPARRMLIHVPEHYLGKSNGLVIEQILANLEATLPPEVFERMQLLSPDHLSGIDPENAKVVIADDWIGRGATLKTDARTVATMLRQAGRTDLIPAIEANLLVAREDQLEDMMFIEDDRRVEPVRRRLPVVAYYRAEGNENALRPFGTHGTNDTNDGTFRAWAILMAAQTGQPVRLPEVALVRAEYKDRYAVRP
jgi:hypothetical protein